MISGGTIPVMMPVSMMTTAVAESSLVMTLTDAASTVNSLHIVCTALTATTADEAASALGHSR